MCRARFCSSPSSRATCSGVASRRLGRPSTSAAFSTAARRCPYCPSARWWRTRVSITSSRRPVSPSGERHRAHAAVAHVDEQRVPLLAEHRRRLVHAAGGRPDDVVLRADAGPGQRRAVEAEVVDVVGRQRHRALQRRRRGQPGPSGTVSVTRTSRPPTAWPAARNAHSTPGDVARPVRRRPRPDVGERDLDPVVLGRALHGEPLVGARRRLDDRALGDRERQAQPLGVVDVLPDEVDPARRGPASVHEPAARSRSAICSGVTSLIQAAIPDSDPARNLSLPGARRRENSCRCSRVRSRPVWTGAWCHPAM